MILGAKSGRTKNTLRRKRVKVVIKNIHLRMLNIKKLTSKNADAHEKNDS